MPFKFSQQVSLSKGNLNGTVSCPCEVITHTAQIIIFPTPNFWFYKMPLQWKRSTQALKLVHNPVGFQRAKNAIFLIKSP